MQQQRSEKIKCYWCRKVNEAWVLNKIYLMEKTTMGTRNVYKQFVMTSDNGEFKEATKVGRIA